MFILPKDIVLKIITGERNYDSISGNRKNEISKGYCFEDQAEVNLSLSKNFRGVCSALEDECKKEQCPLYRKDNPGKI